MSDECRKVAKKLDVHYLYGRWGYSFIQNEPGGGWKFRPSLVPLDGWTFDPHEMTQALFDDPNMEVTIRRKK